MLKEQKVLDESCVATPYTRAESRSGRCRNSCLRQLEAVSVRHWPREYHFDVLTLPDNYRGRVGLLRLSEPDVMSSKAVASIEAEDGGSGSAHTKSFGSTLRALAILWIDQADVPLAPLHTTPKWTP